MTEPYVERDGIIRTGVADPTLVAGVPAVEQPMVAQPLVAQPMVEQPVVEQPTVAQSTVAQSMVAQPTAVVPQVRPLAVVPPIEPVPVAQTVQAVPANAVTRRRFWQIDPAAIITALAGVALLLIGLIVITRAGVEGPLTDPVVDVLGFSHTALLGIIEAVAGVFLLLAGITRSRSGAMFLATILGVAAFVGAVQAESFERRLAIEETFAWLVVGGSLLVLLANLLLPSVRSQSTVYEAH